MTDVLAASDVERLKRFVCLHRVCYEVYPEIAYEGAERRQVGFIIELHGVHEHPEHVSPGCEECVSAQDHLAEIARYVTPKATTDSRYPLDHPRPAIAYSPKRRRAEVWVTLRILHKHDYQAPLDECERECRHAIVASLESLGIQRGRYAGSC